MHLASLSPAVTEILFAIGAEKDIVCVDQFSDWPAEAASIPHLKNHQKIDLEALKKYKPEIVFTSTLVQEKLSQHLKADGSFAVIHQDPRSVDEIYESIRAIGMLVGREKEAEALIASMRQKFNAVEKKARLLPRKLRVYIEEWHHPPMVSGNWVPEIVKIAGGSSFPLEPKAASREVSLGEIQKFDPDLIVLSICGAGKMAEKKLFTDRADWNALRAAQSGGLFVIDDSLLNRPGPRLAEGAERLFGWMFQLTH